MYHLIKSVDVMELTNDVYKAINSYFSTLTYSGYKPYTEVDKLLVYSFVEELLTGPMSIYVTEDDYTSIINSLDCLYGTCTIPYPNYKRSMDYVITNLLDEYRITENNTLRSTTDLELRVKS